MALKTVKVPPDIEPIFRQAEAVVGQFFSHRKDNPESGKIEILGSRYVLVRGASLSVAFFLLVRKLFGQGHEEAADSFTATLLYDLAHAIGKTDAQNFHVEMALEDPIARFSAGPVHFSHTGWAFVDIHPESHPSSDEHYYLIYDHPYSFEADAWMAGDTKPSCPTCVMNAGYSSGWCEESFGINVEARELTCRAMGDAHCRFIMAPLASIQDHIDRYYRHHPEQKQRRPYFQRLDFFARQEVFEALAKGDEHAQVRTAAEKQLLAYARQLEYTQGLLEEKVKQLEVEVEERKRAEAQYRNLVEQINDVVFAVDHEGRFTYISPVIEKMSERKASDIIGRSFSEFVHPEDLDGLRSSFEHTLHGQVEPHEFRVEIQQGNVRYVRTFSRPIVEDGHIVGVRGVMNDITDRKEAEVVRERLIAELEAKNAELERFAYTVSHDLKSPLVTIKGFLGLLQQDIAQSDAARIQDDFEHIATAADNMARLLNELLELSRIGHRFNPPEAVPLTELARMAVQLVAGQIESCGATVEIASDMPMVYGDRVRLLEVLQNLIDNAVKFMGDQPVPRIEIGALQQGETVVCFVQDNGMGIATKYQKKVFGLFEQLDQRVEGTGIGLALVKQILDGHSGRIWVESGGKGKGSTFYFTLPGYETADDG